MDRIKSLNHYQRCILILMIAMVLIFAVVYSSYSRGTYLNPSMTVNAIRIRVWREKQREPASESAPD